jgi:hypothetical protein
MSLERRDIRAKLDPDMHEALAVLADIDQIDIGEFIERELVKVIRERVHGAIETAERTAHLGINGKVRELPGMGTGRGRK